MLEVIASFINPLKTGMSLCAYQAKTKIMLYVFTVIAATTIQSDVYLNI